MSSRILVIGSHPDDIEIGCGGTIRLLADKGDEIKFIIVTSGEEGSLNEKKEELRSIRKMEAVKSAKILGASEILFLDEPDGLTHLKRETKIKLIQFIRNFKPESVFIHSSFDNFSDHQVVSKLSLFAIHAASGPWYSDAGSIPHQVSHIFGFEVWNPIQSPQMNINIEKSMDRKIEALSCHISQITNFNYIGAIRGLNEYRGAMSMSGKFTESFEVIKTKGIL